LFFCLKIWQVVAEVHTLANNQRSFHPTFPKKRLNTYLNANKHNELKQTYK
jgi:hypothetical protein